MQIAKFSLSLLVSSLVSIHAWAQTSEITAAPADGAAVAAPTAPTEATPTEAPPAEAPLAPQEQHAAVDPVILHAEALLAEADGNTQDALTLLRQAAALAADDEVIAYDLARIARDTKSQNAQDFVPLKAITPTAEETALLKAILLSEQGDKVAAKQVIDTFAAESSVRAAGEGTTERKWWSARARLASQFDSNVSVLPNEASGQAAYRLNINAALMAKPFKGRDFTISLALNTGPHMNRSASIPFGASTKPLSFYDASSVILGMTYGRKMGDMRVGLSFTTSQVFIELVSQHFSQDATLGAEFAYKLGIVEAGVFGAAGYRDFNRNFNDETATSGSTTSGLNDRDGALLNGGVRARVAQGIWFAAVQGGYQAQAAQGKNQAEAGPTAGLTAGVDLKPLRLSAGAAYELRDYADSQIASTNSDPNNPTLNKRIDRRTTASANASFTTFSGLDVVAGYAFVLNDSLGQFDYNRHLATVGVEGRW